MPCTLPSLLAFPSTSTQSKADQHPQPPHYCADVRLFIEVAARYRCKSFIVLLKSTIARSTDCDLLPKASKHSATFKKQSRKTYTGQILRRRGDLGIWLGCLYRKPHQCCCNKQIGRVNNIINSSCLRFQLAKAPLHEQHRPWSLLCDGLSHTHAHPSSHTWDVCYGDKIKTPTALLLRPVMVTLMTDLLEAPLSA